MKKKKRQNAHTGNLRRHGLHLHQHENGSSVPPLGSPLRFGPREKGRGANPKSRFAKVQILGSGIGAPFVLLDFLFLVALLLMN